MITILYEKYGPYENVYPEEIEKSSPRKDEVWVKVRDAI